MSASHLSRIYLYCIANNRATIAVATADATPSPNITLLPSIFMEFLENNVGF